MGRDKIKIDYDSEHHLYFMNGNLVHSVTEITGCLHNFGDIPKQKLEAAAKKGTAVHTAIQYYLENDLDENTLDEVIKPYLESFKQWYSYSNMKPVKLEMIVGSLKLQYAGRFDCLMKDKANNLIIVDWKTGIKTKSHSAQGAGYCIAYEEMKRKSGIKSATLYLKPTGFEFIENDTISSKLEFLNALKICRERY